LKDRGLKTCRISLNALLLHVLFKTQFMNITKEQIDALNAVLKVEITREDYQEKVDKILKDYRKNANIPGFRKGKAPKEVVHRRYAETIHTEALKSILPLAYDKVLATGKIRPLGEPIFSDIEANENEPLRFSVQVETVPEVEINDYRGLDVPAEPVAVEPKEIDDVLANVRERNAEYVDIERPAAGGDVVVMDYAPVGLDDKADEEKKVTEFPVELGSGQLMEEFELALTGAVVGKSGRVEIAFSWRPPEIVEVISITCSPQGLTMNTGNRSLYEYARSQG